MNQHRFIAPHLFRTRVVYADTDAGGVVYHARYLEMAERARMAMLHDLNYPIQRLINDHHGLFVVKKLTINYLATAGIETNLVIATQPSALGGSYFTLNQTITTDQQPTTTLAIMEVMLVLVDVHHRRPIRLPSALKKLFIMQNL